MVLQIRDYIRVFPSPGKGLVAEIKGANHLDRRRRDCAVGKGKTDFSARFIDRPGFFLAKLPAVSMFFRDQLQAFETIGDKRFDIELLFRFLFYQSKHVLPEMLRWLI